MTLSRVGTIVASELLNERNRLMEDALTELYCPAEKLRKISFTMLYWCEARTHPVPPRIYELWKLPPL